MGCAVVLDISSSNAVEACRENNSLLSENILLVNSALSWIVSGML